MEIIISETVEGQQRSFTDGLFLEADEFALGVLSPELYEGQQKWNPEKAIIEMLTDKAFSLIKPVRVELTFSNQEWNPLKFNAIQSFQAIGYDEDDDNETVHGYIEPITIKRKLATP